MKFVRILGYLLCLAIAPVVNASGGGSKLVETPLAVKYSTLLHAIPRCRFGSLESLEILKEILIFTHNERLDERLLDCFNNTAIWRAANYTFFTAEQLSHQMGFLKQHNLLSLINSFHDSSNRNLVYFLSDDYRCQPHVYELVRQNPELLIIQDTNGVTALFKLAAHWIRGYREVMKKEDYLSIWTEDFVKKVTEARFGPNNLSFGDFMVYFIAPRKESEVNPANRRVVNHPVFAKYPQLLTPSTAEHGFGNVSMNQYFNSKLRAIDKIGPDFIDQIANSHYYLLFATLPIEFREVVMSEISRRSTKSDEFFSAKLQRTADVFLHRNWKQANYTVEEKEEALKAWNKFIDYLHKFEFEIMVHGVEKKYGSRHDIPSSLIAWSSLESSHHNSDALAVIVFTGGLFGIDFKKSLDINHPYVFDKLTSGLTPFFQHLEPDMVRPGVECVNSMLDHFKVNFFDLEYRGKVLSEEDKPSFLKHKQNVFILLSTKMIISSLRQAYEFGNVTPTLTIDNFYEAIGKRIGLSAPEVAARCKWIESEVQGNKTIEEKEIEEARRRSAEEARQREEEKERLAAEVAKRRAEAEAKRRAAEEARRREEDARRRAVPAPVANPALEFGPVTTENAKEMGIKIATHFKPAINDTPTEKWPNGTTILITLNKTKDEWTRAYRLIIGNFHPDRLTGLTPKDQRAVALTPA